MTHSNFLILISLIKKKNAPYEELSKCLINTTMFPNISQHYDNAARIKEFERLLLQLRER